MPKMMAGKRNAIRITVISLAVCLLLFSAGSMAFAKVTYDGKFPRVDEPEFSGYLRFGDVSGYERTAFRFTSGRNTLTGYLYGAENDKGLVVIAHGLGYDAEHYVSAIVYFVEHGWQVFSFDNTGTHESGGASSRGLPQALEDLEAALTFIESDSSLNGLPVMLYGHSWGGYAVTAILNYDHQVSASVSLSGFNAPDELLLEAAKDAMGAFAYIEYPFLWAYQARLFGNTARLTAVDGINRTTTPVMLIHGNADQEVLYDGASIISHRVSITNPNVIYQTCNIENHNGHNNLFLSEAAVRYANEKNQEYQSLLEEYEGNLPTEVKAAFYSGVDKFQTSELDAGFMNEINRFYEEQLD